MSRKSEKQRTERNRTEQNKAKWNRRQIGIGIERLTTNTTGLRRVWRLNEWLMDGASVWHTASGWSSVVVLSMAWLWAWTVPRNRWCRVRRVELHWAPPPQRTTADDDELWMLQRRKWAENLWQLMTDGQYSYRKALINYYFNFCNLIFNIKIFYTT